MRDRPGRSRGPRTARVGGRVRPVARGSTSGTRPAARRANAAGGAAARTSAPRPSGRFTGRAVVLGVVLLALALSYVFPVRVYLAQRAEISALEESQRAQRAYVEQLETEAARWSDEDFIRSQARQRLYFGEPGEILLITVWDDPAGSPAPAPDPEPAPEPPSTWWDTLWTSLESANQSGGPPPGGDG